MQEEWNLKISARDKTVIGTCAYDNLKNPQKISKILLMLKNFFKNSFFDLKISKTCFLAIFEQKNIELERETRWLKVHVSMIA